MIQIEQLDTENTVLVPMDREVADRKGYGYVTKQDLINGNTSDGYHTFNELYEFRLLYNAAFFNLLAHDAEAAVHKSRFHSDGEPCFGGGWFIVVAYLPGFGQISNHYEEKDWDLFKCDDRIRADEWDGHTPADVAERLRGYLNA